MKMFDGSTLCFHAGTAGDGLLGPYFHHVSVGAVYQDLLWNVLPELLKTADLHTRIHLWFTRDAARPNFLLAGGEFFRNVQQWIGQVGSTALSARHHHLNLFVSYLWRYMKSDVFATEDTEFQNLQ
jgi:hypothetical protein